MLSEIRSPADIKKLTSEELSELCVQLREFLVKSVSKTGGHLASNLGVVELTVALHIVFDSMTDRIIFDVGHQGYVHKMLTGRLTQFDTLRKLGGLSGYPKPSESRHDAFIAGHASTSISAALGIARARSLERRAFDVVPVIGDGALTGGLAFEALSDAGESGEPMVIVLNDNGMSINSNVGGIARYLARQRIKPSYAAFKKRYRRFMEIIPGGSKIYKFTHSVKSAIKETILHCSMFEEMGLQYIGPVDGHNIKELVSALSWAKHLKEPTLVHVISRKGKGYRYSEEQPEKYHGVAPFDYKTGITHDEFKTFSVVFGETLEELARTDNRICAITAAMVTGTGLDGFSKKYPRRFFDVGIAEGHAVTMAAGMAAQGVVPIFAVYSSFLQRSFDNIIHDVGISQLHVVLGIDRAGIVAGDGETHQGIADIAFLSSVPGMTILAPSNFSELRDMLKYAVQKVQGPVAVRYPRGGEGMYKDGGVYTSKLVREGSDITLVTYGISINTAVLAADTLISNGISVEIIKLGIIKEIDYSEIIKSVQKTQHLIVLEECMNTGSIGERITSKLFMEGLHLKSVILKNTGDKYLPCGTREELLRMLELDVRGVVVSITGAVRNG